MSAQQVLLDKRAVAARLSYSTRTVDRKWKAGLMPKPMRIGDNPKNKPLWHPAVIDAWMAGGCKPCQQEGRA